METKTISPGKFGVSYGVILGLVIVVISVIMYITGMSLEGSQWPVWIYYLIFAIIIFYAVNQYKKTNGNLLKLGEAIKIGLVIGVISALFFGVYSIVFHYVIDPEFMGQMMEVAEEKLRENPNLTEEMVEQQMKFVEIFTNPFMMMAWWAAMSLLFGLIYSLIAGLIMKKEAPQY
jgi:hypothetical protein